MARDNPNKVRHLLVILGDQLGDCARGALDQLDPEHDCVWMAEVPEEATHVWSHKARIVLFLSAMRHFRDALESSGVPVCYHASGTHEHKTLASTLAVDLKRYQPETVSMIRAGDMRVQQSIEQTVIKAGLELRVYEDPAFFIDVDCFSEWMKDRKQPRMEHFYRWMRKQTGYLMQDDEPVGGQWNFDKSNRHNFGRKGPCLVTKATCFSTRPYYTCSHCTCA